MLLMSTCDFVDSGIYGDAGGDLSGNLFQLDAQH